MTTREHPRPQGMPSDPAALAKQRADRRNYVLVTGAYWADTLTDGATRMLVLFYFYQLGYSAFQVASLFLFYEIFGIVTNLFGGYLGARFGLKTTLFMGLGIQMVALSLLAFAPPSLLVVPYVMLAQALSGIAKDLTKMSSKSAVKLVAGETQGQLYRWVSILTGSKNAIKGVGFFLGALLLTVVGFQPALLFLGALVLVVLVAAMALIRGELGTANKKAKFTQMFSHQRAVNMLAAARIFLFGTRDVWFVVGLPVFFVSVLGWNFWMAGGFIVSEVAGNFLLQFAHLLLRARFVRRIAIDQIFELPHAVAIDYRGNSGDKIKGRDGLLFDKRGPLVHQGHLLGGEPAQTDNQQEIESERSQEFDADRTTHQLRPFLKLEHCFNRNPNLRAPAEDRAGDLALDPAGDEGVGPCG